MNDSSIHFHYEEIEFSLSDKKEKENWISQVILSEKKKIGQLNFIFCADNYLNIINIDYLNHDTFTDIITFNYNESGTVSGDIFISVERVKENAKELSVPFEQELSRVMVHGILHLIGYNDKTPEQAQEIRAKEDFYLTLQS